MPELSPFQIKSNRTQDSLFNNKLSSVSVYLPTRRHGSIKHSYHTCRETIFNCVKEIIFSDNFISNNPAAISISRNSNLTKEVLKDIVKNMDLLMGNIGILVSPSELLEKSKFGSGFFNTSDEYDESGTYHDSVTLTYLGIPPELFYFDPIFHSMFLGLMRLAVRLSVREMSRRLWEDIDLESVRKAMDRKSRHIARENILTLLGNMKTLFDVLNGDAAVLRTERLNISALGTLDFEKLLKLQRVYKDKLVEDIQARWKFSAWAADGAEYKLFHGWSGIDVY